MPVAPGVAAAFANANDRLIGSAGALARHSELRPGAVAL
jgi:hypothetical protein